MMILRSQKNCEIARFTRTCAMNAMNELQKKQKNVWQILLLSFTIIGKRKKIFKKQEFHPAFLIGIGRGFFFLCLMQPDFVND